ncbi:hypothetical protein EPO66_00150 [bacterium]|nr:MAG: hypothetical protein EPO66_00150 [bacterium]
MTNQDKIQKAIEILGRPVMSYISVVVKQEYDAKIQEATEILMSMLELKCCDHVSLSGSGVCYNCNKKVETETCKKIKKLLYFDGEATQEKYLILNLNAMVGKINELIEVVNNLTRKE